MNALPQRRAIALIADDDDANRMLLADAAEQAGFDVIEASDGQAALDAARAGGFDLALLDVEMPRLDGYELCRALRAEPGLQHKPIMMITGHDDAESIERAFEVGATDFMSKPLNWPLMPHRLKYLLRNALAEERIRHMAYFDALTGLPNLQAFFRVHRRPDCRRGGARTAAAHGHYQGRHGCHRSREPFARP